MHSAHRQWGNTLPTGNFAMRQASERSRGWCFTINNPTYGDSLDVEALKHNARYFVYGKEVGEGGTPHFQGFVYFQHPVTFGRIRQLLQRAHIERQRGTLEQAITYCQKDGDWEEWGDRPQDSQSGKTQKERWRWLIERAEAGDMESIKQEQPGMYLRYFERLRSLARPESNILDELTNEWWYGPTGTGKSRTLWRMYPRHYQKELNKWWCGYQGEEIVAIEEWCPKNECTASALKIWSDRYPFTAQIKGGSLQRIRPKKIIVLSNYTIDQCFPQTEDAEPIKRRFKVVHFPLMFSGQTDTVPDLSEIDAVESLLSL